MSAASSPTKASAEFAANPLLIGRGLPPFSEIKPEHIVPGIERLLKTLEQDLQALEMQLESQLETTLQSPPKSPPESSPSWSELVEPLTNITERLGWSWGVISHLMGVKNSPELRSAYESVQPALVQFANRISQSQVIYDALKRLRKGDRWAGLDSAQQRIVEAALRDAELSGVGLTGEAKVKFNDTQQSLAELSNQFSNHVLDATKAFSLTLTQKDDVAGLPPSLLSLTAQSAREAGANEATPESGPWRITLDMPCYTPFLRHAERRDLREKLYRAFITRASSGEWDNTPLIEQILALRSHQAALLGFENYAELSLARKMASSVSAVETLMEELRAASYEAAKRELEAIEKFAHHSDIKQWDLPYWTERMRESEFDLNDEALRPYFPLPRVLEGLFGLAERLFGISISAADGQAPTWHPDVRYFQVSDADSGDRLAHFYLDPYSRPAEK
ncbi:MAG: M3 family metallopeptidase, partial [Phormidesmis sp.]